MFSTKKKITDDYDRNPVKDLIFSSLSKDDDGYSDLLRVTGNIVVQRFHAFIINDRFECRIICRCLETLVHGSREE